MNKVINVGVIGCGEITQIAHIPYLKELPEFSVYAICDISERVLNAVGDRFGVEKRFVDYKDLLEHPEIDAVLISNMDHAEPAIAALNAGKHVMTEKPMAFNLEEADMMIDAANKNNRKLMVAYMKRYDPGYEWALSLLRNMERPRMIRVHNFAGSFEINHDIYNLVSSADIPVAIINAANEKQTASMIRAIGEERADYLDLYKSLLGLCSHDANILQEAFGFPERIKHVEAYSKVFLIATLQYENNCRCVWETGLITDRPYWDEQLVAYGKEQIIEIRFPFPYLKNAPAVVIVNEMEGGANVTKEVVASYDEAFKREWRHFYECVTKDRKPITSGEKGRADIEFLIDLVKKVRF